MSLYKVSGSQKVAGKEPGETLTKEDLTGTNIDALIASGAITVVTSQPTPTKKEK